MPIIFLVLNQAGAANQYSALKRDNSTAAQSKLPRDFGSWARQLIHLTFPLFAMESERKPAGSCGNMHNKPEPTKLHQSRYDSKTAIRIDFPVSGCRVPKVREKRCTIL